ncbi:MAG: biopolymer transporter ExbD [Bacteroidetes bacterium]|nr:biopolymer transporter ExbD [Bacteroidota bacterium]
MQEPGTRRFLYIHCNSSAGNVAERPETYYITVISLWKPSFPASYYKPIAYGRNFHTRGQRATSRCAPGKKTVYPGRFNPYGRPGFLLITFFVFTTSISEAHAFHLNMPADGPPTPTRQTTTLTVIPVSGEKVFFYHGDLDDAIKSGQYGTTNFSLSEGIGRVIRQKQQALLQTGKYQKTDLVLVIKPDASASYKSVVDALDETLINNVTRYAFTDLSDAERLAMAKLKVH